MIGLCFLYAIQFPWVSFGLNSFDTQPWLLPLNCLGLCIFLPRFISRKILCVIALVVPALLLLVLVVEGAFSPALLRNLALFLICFSSFLLTYFCIKKGVNVLRALIFGNFTYLAVGWIQFFTSPYVADFIVPVRTSATRGVTSLAPEPTFFGLLLVLYIIAFEFLSPNKSKLKLLFIFANLFTIVFVAKSSMGIAVIISIYTFSFLFSLFRRPRLNSFVAVLCLFLLVVLIYSFDIGRPTQLLKHFVRDPLSVVEDDFSVKVRVSHAFTPLLMFVDNFGLPVASSQVNESRSLVVERYGFYSLAFESESDKTSSFLGGYLLLFGLFFLFLLFSIYRETRGSPKHSRFFFSLLFVLVWSIPPALPLVGIMLAILLFDAQGFVLS